MPHKPTHQPPVQERSRESLRRMLDAAEVVLARHGLQGATLPRIAAHARLSPASVYRRFRDKDALMAAVFKRLTDRSSSAAAAQLDPDALRPLGLVRFSHNIIGAMIQNFRADAGLTRAAVQYSERHWERGFVRKARVSEAQSFQKLINAFMLWRDQIKHPDPERGIRFGFIIISIVLRELILFNRMKIFEAIMPLDDATLEQELPRLFLAYLRAEPSQS